MNEEKSEPGSDPETPEIDPEDPTRLDPKRAFEMGADSADPIVSSAWSPPDPEVLDPLFPDYDILELLGRGGMGAVYKGRQKSLDRAVAIKVLPPEMAESDSTFAARFEREAKSMARLDHPNIVHVYDFGRTEMGHCYIVMEFVDGMDFHQLIRSGTLDPQHALNAVSQICDALEYAHEMGYVHRDIKPANIFINQKGVLKVGDFGLAKMIEGEGAEGPSDEPMLTMSGYSVGTPVYCAPEQIEGRPVDQRADIYSLGVMFYEMLTRELPRGNFPPPSRKVEIDVRIDDVVLRAMQSEPEFRYSSAGEMRTEVEAVRTGVPEAGREGTADAETSRQTPESSPTAPPRRMALMILGGVALCFLIWAGITFLGGPAEQKAKPADANEKGSQGPPTASAENTSFPLPLPEFPPKRPTIKCRLVILPIDPSNNEELKWFRRMGTDNFDDVVSLIGQNYNYIAAIRREGKVATYGEYGEAEEFSDRFRVSAGTSFSGSIVLLSETGRVAAVSRSRGLYFLDDLVDIAQVSRFGFSSLFLTRDGRIHAHNSQGPVSLDHIETDNVAEISGRSILYRNGECIYVNEKGEASFWLAPSRIKSLVADFIGIDANGQFRTQDGSKLIPPLDRLGKTHNRVLSLDGHVGLMALRDEDGEVALAIRGRSEYGSTFESVNPNLEAAFQGAEDVVMIRSPATEDPTFLAALLPADTVSRSGYWEVEDLIEDRRKLREQKGVIPVASEDRAGEAGKSVRSPFPLPRPEFPPKRPQVKCRLVIIPISESSTQEQPWEWMQGVEQDDLGDIVALQESGATNAAVQLVIRANGDVKAWSDGEWSTYVNSVGQLEAVAATLLKNGSIAVLNENGRLTEVSPHRKVLDLPTQAGGVAQIASHENGLLWLDRDGSLHFSRSLSSSNWELPEGDWTGIHSLVGHRLNAGISVLFQDGEWTHVPKFKNPVETWPVPVIRAFSANLAMQENGEIANRFSLKVRKDITSISARDIEWVHSVRFGGGIIAGLRDGSVQAFVFHNYGSGGRLEEISEATTSAVHGAVEARFLNDNPDESAKFIAALLPADTVSRSGYWDVEDLIEDRRKLREANAN